MNTKITRHVIIERIQCNYILTHIHVAPSRCREYIINIGSRLDTLSQRMATSALTLKWSFLWQYKKLFSYFISINKIQIFLRPQKRSNKTKNRLLEPKQREGGDGSRKLVFLRDTLKNLQSFILKANFTFRNTKKTMKRNWKRKEIKTSQESLIERRAVLGIWFACCSGTTSSCVCHLHTTQSHNWISGPLPCPAWP